MSQFEFLLEGAYILSGKLHQQCGQPKTVESLANGTKGSVAGEHLLGIRQDYALTVTKYQTGGNLRKDRLTAV